MVGRVRTFVTAAGLAAAVAGVHGCGMGPPPGAPNAKGHPVSGKVTLADGKPAKGVIVAFIPVETDAGGGKLRATMDVMTNQDGTYRITSGIDGDKGVAVGEFKVKVTPVDNESSKIPEMYQKVETTPLSYTATDGDNKLDIVIK